MSSFDDFIEYKPETVLFSEGDESRFLYLISTGEIKVVQRRESDERLILISTLGPGSILGSASVFNDQKRTVSAIVVESSKIMIIKKTDIKKVLRECPDWVSNITLTLADRLKSTINLLVEHGISDSKVGALEATEEKKIKNLIKDHQERFLRA